MPGVRSTLSQASPEQWRVLEAFVKRLRQPIAREATILSRGGREWKELQVLGGLAQDFSSPQPGPGQAPDALPD